MKGYFIVHEQFDNENLTGIQRKILSQINAFRHYGLECEKYYISNGVEKGGRLLSAFLAMLPFGNRYPMWQIPKNIEDIDYIYLRRPFCMSWSMRRWVKKIRRKKKDIKIYVEIPTYPYDNEFNSIVLKPFLIKDRYNRNKMKGVIDGLCFASFEKRPEEMWGVPTVSFVNGIDVDSIKKCTKPYSSEEIHLMCIAMFRYWHGYDRLLEGMIGYYKAGGKKKVVCHFVGEGEELLKYQKIAENPLIKDNIVFHGRMYGSALDDLYDTIDIGICSLGGHRRNKDEITAELKSREYMARGIPFVVSGRMDVLENTDLFFAHQVKAIDLPIDIGKIISFYEAVNEKEDYREEIREFAKNNIDMSITMRPIIDFVNREVKEK